MLAPLIPGFVGMPRRSAKQGFRLGCYPCLPASEVHLLREASKRGHVCPLCYYNPTLSSTSRG